MASDTNIKIIWDQGTAYDYLSSLHVLHFPDEFGLRGAWAAGVRSRLPADSREFLEAVVGNMNTPLAWIYSLPDPKDAATVLLALKRIPVRERLGVLKLSPVDSAEVKALLGAVTEKGNWDQDDLDQLMRLWRNAGSAHRVIPGPVKEKRAAKVLDMYADPECFGEVYLDSLDTYYQVFFSEEEKRIAPKLTQALERARAVAAEDGDTTYLEVIKSRLGVEMLDQVETVVLAPSYWCSPAHQHSGGHTEMVLLFSARPKEESLVPGEIVPEDLLLRLKAMTDPTRMRILRYLIQEQLTPAELARRLRLRAPTVTHHLHTLKASGMVEFVKKGKNEHLYYAKMDSIKETYVLLKDFLEEDVTKAVGFDFFDNELI